MKLLIVGLLSIAVLFLNVSCDTRLNTFKTYDTPKVEITKSPDPTVDPQNVADSAKDLTACGGSPGKITLVGMFAKDRSQNLLDVEQYPGKGWRRECKAPKSGEIERIPELSEATLKALEELKTLNTFALIGCEKDTVSSKDLEGLTETHPIVDEKGQITTIKGTLIILCGENESLIRTPIVLIQGYAVWVRGFGHDSIGTSAALFSITAKNFGFSGSFGFTSKGLDDSVTLLDGPSIYLAAHDFLNEPQKSYVSAKGANYIEKASENKKMD